MHVALLSDRLYWRRRYNYVYPKFENSFKYAKNRVKTNNRYPYMNSIEKFKQTFTKHPISIENKLFKFNHRQCTQSQ